MKRLNKVFFTFLSLGLMTLLMANNGAQHSCSTPTPDGLVFQTEPSAAQKFFNEELPNCFATDPSKALFIGFNYQVDISGEGGGQWFINTRDATPTCTEGKNSEQTYCIVKMSTQTFQSIYANPSSITAAFVTGKITVSFAPGGQKFDKILKYCR